MQRRGALATSRSAGTSRPPQPRVASLNRTAADLVAHRNEEFISQWQPPVRPDPRGAPHLRAFRRCGDKQPHPDPRAPSRSAVHRGRVDSGSRIFAGEGVILLIRCGDRSGSAVFSQQLPPWSGSSFSWVETKTPSTPGPRCENSCAIATGTACSANQGCLFLREARLPGRLVLWYPNRFSQLSSYEPS